MVMDFTLQLIKEICYTYSIHIERFPSHSTHHKPMKPHYRHTIHNYIPLNTLQIIPIPSISHTLITQQHQIPFLTYPHRYLSNSMERISDRITPLLTPYHTIHKSPLILLLTTSHSSYYTLSLHHTTILHNTSILIPPSLTQSPSYTTPQSTHPQHTHFYHLSHYHYHHSTTILQFSLSN